MKMLGTFGAMLMLAGFAFGSTTTAPAPRTYTLGTDDNPNLSQNPTPSQIKAAIATLEGQKIHAVFISVDEKHSIQANWESAQEVGFQYVDGGDDRTFESRTKKYSPEVALAVLMSYSVGGGDWQKMIDWELMK
jgi:hypothetical protein